MMNRMMTVKLSLFKREKTGNRQAVSNQLQISDFDRQKQLSVFCCCLSAHWLFEAKSLMNDTDWTAHLLESYFKMCNRIYLPYLNRILCLSHQNPIKK